MATPGEPVSSAYDIFTLTFKYAFRNLALEEAEKPAKPASHVTEIYLPSRSFAKPFKENSVRVTISDGIWEWDKTVGLDRIPPIQIRCLIVFPQRQLLFWTYENETSAYLHSIKIEVIDKKYWKKKLPNIDFTGTSLEWIIPLVAATLAVLIQLIWKFHNVSLYT